MGANLVELLCPGQQRLCKGGIMSMSRRKQKEEMLYDGLSRK